MWVTLVEVSEGMEDDFVALALEFEDVLAKEELRPRGDGARRGASRCRLYAVRRWVDLAAAEACHADNEVQALTTRLYRLARVTHLVNGVRHAEPSWH